MKLGTIFCITLIVITTITSLAQFLFSPFETAFFIRALLSLIAVLLITVAIILVKQENNETDQLKNEI